MAKTWFKKKYYNNIAKRTGSNILNKFHIVKCKVHMYSCFVMIIDDGGNSRDLSEAQTEISWPLGTPCAEPVCKIFTFGKNLFNILLRKTPSEHSSPTCHISHFYTCQHLGAFLVKQVPSDEHSLLHTYFENFCLI